MSLATKVLGLVGLERKTVLSTTDAKAARLWGRLFGMGDTASGKTVTVDSAMQLSAVWACVRLISETVATLPLMVYRRHPDGGREVASDHPLYRLLHDVPNADQTAVEFIEGLVLSLCLNGNAFAEKVRRSDGTIIALQPMAFDRTSVKRRPDGALEYRYSDGQRVRTLGEDDVFHVRGFGNGGDVGLSPISYARQTLGIAMAADEAAGKMFANGVRPSGVLQTDTILKADQRKDIRENVVGPLAGSSNAGGIFVLEGGMKFSAVSLSPKDAEMATARRWHVEEICRWFGMPPILIGHASEGQTMWGTGVGQIKQGWYTLGLRPLLRRIEAAIHRALLTPAERKTFSAEFVVEGFLRADSEARFGLYATAVQNGIRSRNEVRELENMPRVEGGDELTVQSNLLPLQMLGKTTKPVASAPGDDDADEGDDGGGPTGQPPFEEVKAFDPEKHPRDENGKFKGRGAGRGRRIARLVKRSWLDKLFRDNLDLGAVDAVRFSAASGQSVSGWRFAIRSDEIRHIRSTHGSAREALRGQSPIIPDDFKKLARVLTRSTSIQSSKSISKRMKNRMIEVEHSIGRWRYHVDLAVQPGRKALVVQSFRKRKR